jgi:cytochrome c553
MNTSSRLLVPLALTWAVSSAWAGDPEVGRQKAQLCAACHGPMGLAAMPNTPNLAGQPEQYLVEQLKAYRSGKRVHEQMSLLAKPLSDDDIANVSAWYSSLQVQIKN